MISFKYIHFISESFKKGNLFHHVIVYILSLSVCLNKMSVIILQNIYFGGVNV